jgi:hypothetical protein
MALALLLLSGAGAAALAAQSAIVEADGYSCMGVDKSRKQTEQEARADAKRNAVENAKTYVRSQTQVKDLELAHDLIEAYTGAAVTIVEELRSGWYRDDAAGECFRVRVKAEVVPDEKVLGTAAGRVYEAESAAAPLHVTLWTDKSEYREGERIMVYLKGNRSFYARVLYHDAQGQTVQILPNPLRRENSFEGGTVYEIPSGDDRFRMEVTPPFGAERIVIQASTAPLGELELQDEGAVYGVKTRAADIGRKSRGVKLVPSTAAQPAGAQFSEGQVDLRTAAK